MTVNIEDLKVVQDNKSKLRIITTDYSMATRSYDIFFSGCAAKPRCTGCHNPEAWDFNQGIDWKQHIFKINKDVMTFGKLIDKFFILGGEPLDQDREEFLLCMDAFKEFKKPLWLFTRFELDEIPDEVKEVFDYIKTGPYKPELSTNDNCCYGVKLATSNQKIFKKGVDY